MKCNICPRECGADRDKGQLGVCGVSNDIRVARISLHMWEEPCISGAEGSGTVFFVGCNLGCIYCQNYKISRGLKNSTCNNKDDASFGHIYSVERLADEFLSLQERQANNINLVTPTHYSMQIIDAIKIARNKGLTVPIVYNCGGYEKAETLRALQDVVDIYLTDFKYIESDLSRRLSGASDYGLIAKKALAEMVGQHPSCEFDKRGIMQKGVIVRNLLLPGNVNNSKDVIRYVYETYGDSVYISAMNQYTPLEQVSQITDLNRKVTKREYNRLLDFIFELGIQNAYIQDGDVASESFIPDFQ